MPAVTLTKYDEIDALQKTARLERYRWGNTRALWVQVTPCGTKSWVYRGDGGHSHHLSPQVHAIEGGGEGM